MTKITYRVQNAQTGEVLAEGYAEDCIRKLGCSKSTLQTRRYRDPDHVGPRQRFLITVLDEPEKPGWAMTGEQLDAAKRWDAFCEPLRKKYGIEVKRWPQTVIWKRSETGNRR